MYCPCAKEIIYQSGNRIAPCYTAVVPAARLFLISCDFCTQYVHTRYQYASQHVYPHWTKIPEVYPRYRLHFFAGAFSSQVQCAQSIIWGFVWYVGGMRYRAGVNGESARAGCVSRSPWFFFPFGDGEKYFNHFISPLGHQRCRRDNDEHALKLLEHTTYREALQGSRIATCRARVKGREDLRVAEYDKRVQP